MCGRARLATDYAEIKIRLKIPDDSPAPNVRPSWNIAPTQDVLAVIAAPARIARTMRWGLVPSWSKDGKPKIPAFNARSETIATTALFRGAWRAGRRCLVVTDGFYEWRKSDKQPFAIAAADGGLTVMAGIWEAWRSAEGETVTSCAVLTTAADAMMAPLHDRMPVILDEADWPAWLGEGGAPGADSLIKARAARPLVAWAVDRRVGSVRNNDGDLVAPLPVTAAPLAK